MRTTFAAILVAASLGAFGTTAEAGNASIGNLPTEWLLDEIAARAPDRPYSR